MGEIEYLSRPSEVSMADEWFDIAHLNHFWIKRRYAVFHKLYRRLIGPRARLAEIGCGNGLLQRQIEIGLKLSVDGFDLNEYALRRNISRRSRVICYDVFDRSSIVKDTYDFVFLFDVLEHVEDQVEFLQAITHLIKPRGSIFVNVPAFMTFYSQYDVEAGHVRRYNVHDVRHVFKACGISLKLWTYWGFPMSALLWARKLQAHYPKEVIIEAGFAASGFKNWLLARVSQFEFVPQHFFGTSFMGMGIVDSQD